MRTTSDRRSGFGAEIGCGARTRTCAAVLILLAAGISEGAPRIELVPPGKGVTVTDSGGRVAYAQVTHEEEPNPNPRFDEWGVVPAAVAGKVRELLIQEAGKSPDFPSVLLKGYPPDPERSNDILFIGKHVDPALAHAILRHAKELGIRKILYSQVHDTFIIGPDKPLLVFPDIAGSLKEYYPDLDKEGDAVPKRGGGGEADAVAE